MTRSISDELRLFARRMFPAMRSSARNDKLVQAGVLTVGRQTYGNPAILSWGPPNDPLQGASRVSIGSFCAIGRHVNIYTGGNHRTDWVTTFPLRIKYGLDQAWVDGCPGTNGDVRIGHDVWIANHATILSGVMIGDGAVVAAHSVVTRNVDPYTMVGGNPARVLRKRFTDEQIAALLDIRWWEWNDDRIIDAVPKLACDDVDGFIRWAQGSL